MRFLSKLSIEKKVLAGFAVALVVICSVAVVSYSEATDSLENEQLVGHTYEVLAELEGLRFSIVGVTADQRGYLLTGNSTYLTSFNGRIQEAQQHLEKLLTLTTDNPIQQHRIAEIRPNVNRHFAILARTIEIYNTEGAEAARQQVVTRVGQGEADAIRSIIAQMEGNERTLLEIRRQNTLNNTHSSQGLYALLIALMLGTMGGFYILINRDIRDRKLVEQKLRETLTDLEVQYRAVNAARGESAAVLNATSEAIILLSPEGSVISVNRRFAEFFGYKLEDVLGQNITSLQSIVERIFADPAALRVRLAGLTTNNSVSFTEIAQQKWPQERELQLYSAPVFTQDNAYLGRLFVFRDVTHERQIDRMKSEFVSLVSHELRTPLTSIKGFVDLLLDREVGEINEEQEEFLGIVKSNSDRLVLLINDLLDLSRIESGKLELKKVPTQMAELIGRVIVSMRPQIEQKKQRLSIDLNHNLPPVLGDENRITQIITNLISNAHKYTPAGGEITVKAVAEGRFVRVDVIDNGIGMTEEERGKLFERFFRAKNRTTQEVGGTGLGLTITRTLVQMHGGDVTVHTAPGKGSTFSFTLPMADTLGAEKIIEPLLPPGGRVLVVDDEPDISSLMRRYLERGGYKVLVAQTASDALHLARTEHPDLITLDVRLPDADGFTLLEWIKSDPETAAIPVIMISMMDDEGRGKLLGAVDYLTKPVREELLLSRIAHVITNGSSRVVMVAEDDSSIRKLLCGHLRRAGYDVVEAVDGEQAVQLAREQRPAVALIDIKMPRMDGITALQTLRADPITRNMPIIMMTASPGIIESNRTTIESLGSTLLMSKPSTAEELVAVIGGTLY